MKFFKEKFTIRGLILYVCIWALTFVTQQVLLGYGFKSVTAILIMSGMVVVGFLSLYIKDLIEFLLDVFYLHPILQKNLMYLETCGLAPCEFYRFKYPRAAGYVKRHCDKDYIAISRSRTTRDKSSRVEIGSVLIHEITHKLLQHLEIGRIIPYEGCLLNTDALRELEVYAVVTNVLAELGDRKAALPHLLKAQAYLREDRLCVQIEHEDGSKSIPTCCQWDLPKYREVRSSDIHKYVVQKLVDDIREGRLLIA